MTHPSPLDGRGVGNRLRIAATLAAGVAIGAGVTLAIVGRGPGAGSAGGTPGAGMAAAHDPRAMFPAPRASMAAGPGQSAGMGPGEVPTLPDVETMIAGLRDRLAGDPSDARGWAMLGWSYASTGRPAEAVSAYERAAALLPDDPDILGSLGAARVAVAGGQIDAELRALFDRVIGIDPTDARALYYAGLAREQDGATEEGRALLQRALEASPPDAPWLGDLRARLAGPSP